MDETIGTFWGVWESDALLWFCDVSIDSIPTERP